MRTWLAIVTLCAASLVVGPAEAWWDGGHMQIAAVAYDRLDPAVRAKVDALIKLNPGYSKWVDGFRTPIATASPSSMPRPGLTTLRMKLAKPTRAIPRRATTRRETSAMQISCDTNAGTISTFLSSRTEPLCVRLTR